MYSFDGLGNAPSNSKSLPSRLTPDRPKNNQFISHTVHSHRKLKRHREVAPLKADDARKSGILREDRSRLAQWFYNLPVRAKNSFRSDHYGSLLYPRPDCRAVSAIH